MPEFKRAQAFAALVALVGVALAPAARADVLLPDMPETGRATDSDRADARAAYEDATEAYGAGRLDDALDAADRAWKALPNASTALIRATILGDLKRDRDAFEAYLQAADLTPAPEETSLIDAGLAKHGPRVSPPMGWIVVRSTPAGADANLDGHAFRTPRTVGISAGKHALELEADGYRPAQSTVTARSGRATTSMTKLVTAPDGAATAPQHPDAVERETEAEAEAEAETEEIEEAEPPPEPKLPHQRVQLRPFFNLGFPGKSKQALSDGIDTATSNTLGLDVSFGGGLYLDIPLRSVFALGVELSVASWQTEFHNDNDLGPNYTIDIGFVPRFRVPFGRVAEAYVSIPLGLTIAIDNTVDFSDEETRNIGPGFFLGIYLGGKFYFAERFGVFLEGGWTAHVAIFATDPTTTWTTRHGSMRAGVAFLF